MSRFDLLSADDQTAEPVEHAWMREAVRFARARQPLPILLLGERGTGKSTLAERLHALSGRTGAFVEVNAGELAGELAASVLFGHVRGAFTGAVAERKGAFGQAQYGTLFLDDIQNLPLETQRQLLGVLSGRGFLQVGGVRELQVSVRLILATNADPRALLEEGTLLPDFLDRLGDCVVEVPPLRARRDAGGHDALPVCHQRPGRVPHPRDPSGIDERTPDRVSVRVRCGALASDQLRAASGGRHAAARPDPFPAASVGRASRAGQGG